MASSRWEQMLWPRWLPRTARMPLVAQVTGAVALTALIMGPWWSRVPSAPQAPGTLPASARVETPATVPLKPAVTPTAPVTQAPMRPAHLNLDVRHSFASVDLSVTVDGKRALDSKLEGNGKKFKMFGKRAERSFTRTLDLQPGVRLVRVTLRAPQDRFEQTRVERFELGEAQVAALRINADENGMSAAVDRPPVLPSATNPLSAEPSAPRPPQPVVTASALPQPAPAPSSSSQRRDDAVANLLNSLRSILIGIAGFVATTSAGFVLEQFLGAKKRLFEEKRRPTPDSISPP